MTDPLTSTADTARRLTGWHVAGGFVAAFSVIIAVNVTMAMKATGTFPGLETKNTWVASQTFDDDRAAQEALGWTARATHRGGMVRIALTDSAGRPAPAAAVEAVVGRATEAADDVAPALAFDGAAWIAPVALSGGRWQVRLIARAEDGTLFRQRLSLVMEN